MMSSGGGGGSFAVRGSPGPGPRAFSGGTVRQFSSGGPQFSSGPRVVSGPVVSGRPFVQHRRFRHGPIIAFGFAPYAYGYSTYDDCYQWQQVPTRYGWTYQWVNVCYDYDYDY